MSLTTPQGFIYVIHAVGTNRIKLGFSKDPAERLKILQTGSPYPLRLLDYWPGDEADERRAHLIMSLYRQTGEWFDVPPFARSRIRELIAAGRAEGRMPMTARECLLLALPEARKGAWWELCAKTYGYAIKLRWRDGKRKCVYGFEGLRYRLVEVLQEADPEHRKRLLCGHLLGELYDANRRDVARRIKL